MQASQIPTKFVIPFANNAAAGTSRQVPQASQVSTNPGAASLYDGFPTATGQPLASGGVPPAMQDFNGLFNQITAWSRWQNVGGTVQFDQAFCNAVGGYPQGAILASTAAGRLWLNTIDNNTTNPDGTGAQNWVKLILASDLANQSVINQISIGLENNIQTTIFQKSSTTSLGNGYATTLTFTDPSVPSVFANDGIGNFTCYSPGVYNIGIYVTVTTTVNQASANDSFVQIMINGQKLGFNKSPYYAVGAENYIGYVGATLYYGSLRLNYGDVIYFAAGATVPTGFVSAVGQNHVASFTRLF